MAWQNRKRKFNSVDSHVPVFEGKHDRFCNWCGTVIVKQNLEKPEVCPNMHCGRSIPLRNILNVEGVRVQWSSTGFGRCVSCDSLTHKAYFYCGSCGKKNLETIRAKAEAEAKEKEEELKKKDEAVKEQAMKLKEMEVLVQELQKKLEKKEDEKVEKLMGELELAEFQPQDAASKTEDDLLKE